MGVKDQTIADIMHKNIISVTSTTSARLCAKKMTKERVGCIIVMDDKEPAGIITERGFADLVKLEVNSNNIGIVEYLVSKSIPTCAHIGLLPQTIKTKSGYRKYGKSKKEACVIYNLALELTQIGVDIILLECLESRLARRICNDCSIPVIGIGSGT